MAPKRKASDASLSPGPEHTKKAIPDSIIEGLRNLLKPTGTPSTDLAAPHPPNSMLLTHPGLCQRLEEDSRQRMPRFLFRVWSATSGGIAGLNTATAITPRAFHAGRNQPPLWHHSYTAIVKNAADHVSYNMNPSNPTFFSSWSQSLQFVLAFGNLGRATHIGIIDTHMLSDQNIVLYTPILGEITRDQVPSLSIEYIIYGTIDGAAYQSLALEDLETIGLQRLFPSLFRQRTALSDALAIAQAVGSRFTNRFELAVAACAFTMESRSAREVCTLVRELLEKQRVPKEWAEDLSLMSAAPVETGGERDADQAIDILRILTQTNLRAQNTCKQSRGQTSREGLHQDKKLVKTNEAPVDSKATDDGDGLKDGTVRSGRLSAAAMDLYIDIVGWTPADLARLSRTRGSAKD